MDSTKVLREAMLAYQAVYDEDLREEIQFENWVNSLVEEGYDLSGYTWEDMYEVYISEMGQVRTTGQTSSVFRPTPGAGSAGGSGSGGRRGGGSSPGALKPTAAPAKPQPQMKGLSIGQGGFRVNNRPVNTGVSPIFQRPGATARPAAAPATRPAAAPATRPAATPTTSRPASSTATTTARPTSTPSAKPTPTATAKPPVGSGYKKDTSVTDMIGRSQIRQGAPINTGNKSSDIRSMAMRGTASGGLPTSPTSKSTPARPMGSRKPGSIVSGFDLFDVVKGYLLDEGYADTEEAALVIMANMSEDWRESIVDEMLDEALTGERYKKVMKKPSGTAYSRKVSADPSKRATRGGKGGESDFGAGDRGSGNKAARRAGTYRED